MAPRKAIGALKPAQDIRKVKLTVAGASPKKPRRSPKQAVVKNIGDLAMEASRVYAEQDPQLAKQWAALARRAYKLSTPRPAK